MILKINKQFQDTLLNFPRKVMFRHLIQQHTYRYSNRKLNPYEESLIPSLNTLNQVCFKHGQMNSIQCKVIPLSHMIVIPLLQSLRQLSLQLAQVPPSRNKFSSCIYLFIYFFYEKSKPAPFLYFNHCCLYEKFSEFLIIINLKFNISYLKQETKIFQNFININFKFKIFFCKFFSYP